MYYREYIVPIMENQMETNLEKDMESGIIPSFVGFGVPKIRIFFVEVPIRSTIGCMLGPAYGNFLWSLSGYAGPLNSSAWGRIEQVRGSHSNQRRIKYCAMSSTAHFLK